MTAAVSIIIPCYRCETTIAEAVEGVLAQTVGDWECILVSDDGTSYLDMLRDRGIDDARLKEHPVRTDGTGTVAPRNRGMELARGEFVADLDADDVWAPERLAKLLPLAAEHDVCFDVLELFAGTGHVIGYSGVPDGETELLEPAAIVAMDFPFHVIARRARLGGRWAWHDSWVPDVVRTFWLATMRPVCRLREPLLRYRVSTSSMSQSKEGARCIDHDYGAILQDLEHGRLEPIPRRYHRDLEAGMTRKRALNRAYMEATAGTDRPLSFLEWILATRRSGHRA